MLKSAAAMAMAKIRTLMPKPSATRSCDCGTKPRTFVGGRLLVRQENRHRGVAQDVTGDAAERDFAQTAVFVATHDQQAGGRTLGGIDEGHGCTLRARIDAVLDGLEAMQTQIVAQAVEADGVDWAA